MKAMLSRRRVASVIVLVAISLTALLLFMGLAVDVGYWYQRRSQVQMNADLAALTSLAANNSNASYTSQTSFVNSLASGIMTNNGYSTSDFTVSVQPDSSTTPTRVSTVTVTVTQQVPTFFWHVFTATQPLMSTLASAEGDKVVLPVPPCAFVAVDRVNTAVDSTGTAGSVDSFVQNSTAYSGSGGCVNYASSFNNNVNGYNPSLVSTPFAYDRANATGCANGSISDQHNQAGSLFSSLGNVQTGAEVGNDFAAGTASGAVAPYQDFSNQTLPVFSLPPVPNPAAANSGSFGTACVAGDSKNPSCTPISATFNNNSNITGGSGSGSTAWTGGEVLTCGSNYFVTDITDHGGSCITVANGPCDVRNPIRVYLNGAISLSGNVGINPGGLPSDITVYGISTNPSSQIFDLGGDDAENMNVYAPAYDVNLHGKGRLFGDVNANTIDLKGVGGFSYDESLGFPATFTNSFQIKVHLSQ